MSARVAGSKNLSEDWLSVWIDLGVFALALGLLAGADLLGWAVRTSVWTDVSRSLSPVSSGYKAVGGLGALLATYAFLLAVTRAARTPAPQKRTMYTRRDTCCRASLRQPPAHRRTRCPD